MSLIDGASNVVYAGESRFLRFRLGAHEGVINEVEIRLYDPDGTQGEVWRLSTGTVTSEGMDVYSVVAAFVEEGWYTATALATSSGGDTAAARESVFVTALSPGLAGGTV